MSDFMAGLANLSVETTELPQRTSGRGRKVKDNPFTAWVSESYADKTGRSVTVPKAHVKDAQYLVRAAAADLGIGVRIVLTDSKGNKLDNAKLEGLSDKTYVKVMFQGQEKRKYEKKVETSETASE